MRISKLTIATTTNHYDHFGICEALATYDQRCRNVALRGAQRQHPAGADPRSAEKPADNAARALVFPDEFYKRLGVGLPVHRKPFEVFKHRVHPKADEEGHRVFSVFVEVCVEDSLIH